MEENKEIIKQVILEPEEKIKHVTNTSYYNRSKVVKRVDENILFL